MLAPPAASGFSRTLQLGPSGAVTVGLGASGAGGAGAWARAAPAIRTNASAPTTAAAIRFARMSRPIWPKRGLRSDILLEIAANTTPDGMSGRGYSRSMILSDNRYTLFGIML
jgi:hypothetical protein